MVSGLGERRSSPTLSKAGTKKTDPRGYGTPIVILPAEPVVSVSIDGATPSRRSNPGTVLWNDGAAFLSTLSLPTYLSSPFLFIDSLSPKDGRQRFDPPAMDFSPSPSFRMFCSPLARDAPPSLRARRSRRSFYLSLRPSVPPRHLVARPLAVSVPPSTRHRLPLRPSL